MRPAGIVPVSFLSLLLLAGCLTPVQQIRLGAEDFAILEIQLRG